MFWIYGQSLHRQGAFEALVLEGTLSCVSWAVPEEVRCGEAKPAKTSNPVRPPGACARGGAMAAVRQIEDFLESQGLATDEVLAWIQQEEIEYIDDLAHAFRSTKHIRDEAQFMLEAWMTAARRKTEAWRRSTDFAEAQRALSEALRAISATCQAKLGPRGRGQPKGRLSGKPRPKPVAKAALLDAKQRRGSAVAAVDLSLSWAPEAGLAQGLSRDDPLLRMVREVHEERLSLFEPKVVWAALNNWTEWEEYLKKCRAASTCAGVASTYAADVQCVLATACR